MRVLQVLTAAFMMLASGQAYAMTVKYEYELVLTDYYHSYAQFYINPYERGDPIWNYTPSYASNIIGRRYQQELEAEYDASGNLMRLTECFSVVCYDKPLDEVERAADDVFSLVGIYCGCYAETYDFTTRPDGMSWTYETDDLEDSADANGAYFFSGIIQQGRVENLVKSVNGTVMDGPKVVATPLPAGLPMLLAGLAAFGWVRRRR